MDTELQSWKISMPYVKPIIQSQINMLKWFYLVNFMRLPEYLILSP